MKKLLYAILILAFLPVSFSRPICKFDGTRSEGWYDEDGLIKYADCDSCEAVCKITRIEGWYSSCDNSLIKVEKCAVDLVVVNSSLLPVSDGYRVAYYIKNRGEYNVSNFFSSLYINGKLMSSDLIYNIDAGETKAEMFPFTFTKNLCVNNYANFSIIVDSKNNIYESNESNNEYNFIYDCSTPKPDLIVKNITLYYDKPKDIKIRVWIKNQGNAKSGPCKVKVYSNAQQISEAQVPSIDPGVSIYVDMPNLWTPVSPSNNLEAIVDADKEVEELDESNNGYSKIAEFQMSCFDGIKNRDEEGVDCGGTFCAPCNRCNLTSLPSHFDWRDYAPLPPIRDQQDCGSCWAHSAVGAVECHEAVHKGEQIDLSEQYLISCAGVGSCGGGSLFGALQYIQSDGVGEEVCLPYQHSSNVSCVSCPTLYFLQQVSHVSSDIETIKRYLICYGPLSAATSNYVHAVVIVGYDDASQKWIIRNSYGVGVGDHGYTSAFYKRGDEIIVLDSNGDKIQQINTKFRKWYSLGTWGDIIVVVRRDDKITFLNKLGLELKTVDLPFDYEARDNACVGDVDGDGEADIAILDISKSKIRIVDHTASLINEINIIDFTLGNKSIEHESIACGDVNGDGRDEIIYGNKNASRIYVLDLNGTILQTFDENHYIEFDGLATADVDGDGVKEIIYGSRHENFIRAYRLNGTILGEVHTNFAKHDAIASGDTNNDGKDELVYVSKMNKILHIYTFNQTNFNEITHWNMNYYLGDRIALLDVDNDDHTDILWGQEEVNSDLRFNVYAVKGVYSQ